MGYGVAHRTYHNIVVRKQITPKIPSFTPIMAKEIEESFNEAIGAPQGLCSDFSVSLRVDKKHRIYPSIIVQYCRHDGSASEQQNLC